MTTIACNLDKLIPDAKIRKKLQRAVLEVHKATTLASELINLHIRRLLGTTPPIPMDELVAKFKNLYNASWVKTNVYMLVSFHSKGGKRKPADESVCETFKLHMDKGERADRQHTSNQALMHESRALIAAARNMMWMHFRAHILKHVKVRLALSEADYKRASAEEKKRHRTMVSQVADDMLRPPGAARSSPSQHHTWLEDEQERIGLGRGLSRVSETVQLLPTLLELLTGMPLCYMQVITDWNGKNQHLLTHLKNRPEAFLPVLAFLAKERDAGTQEGQALSGLSLFPLRRSNVPCHMHVDVDVLHQLEMVPTQGKSTRLAWQQKVFGTVVDLKGAQGR